jgi:hypothetical protein
MGHQLLPIVCKVNPFQQNSFMMRSSQPMHPYNYCTEIQCVFDQRLKLLEMVRFFSFRLGKEVGNDAFRTPASSFPLGFLPYVSLYESVSFPSTPSSVCLCTELSFICLLNDLWHLLYYFHVYVVKC